MPVFHRLTPFFLVSSAPGVVATIAAAVVVATLITS
jgi:hypothetical protein